MKRNRELIGILILTAQIVLPAAGLAATVDICSDITADTTWTSDNVYTIQGCHISIRAGATLTIQPGTVVKLRNTSAYSYGLINVYGGLTAVGTPEAPVVFTSLRDDGYGGDTNGDGSATKPAKGNWGRIVVLGSGTATFRDAVLAYGGVGYEFGRYYILYAEAGTTVSLERTTVTESYGTGIRSEGNGIDLADCDITNNYGSGFAYNGVAARDLTIRDSRFTGNGWPGGITFNTTVPPRLTMRDNTVTGNGVNGFDVGGTIGGTTTWEIRNSAPLTLYGGNLTVSPAGSLTLLAGTILKAATVNWGGGMIAVQGELRALGTPLEPVVLTSFQDDAHGGDTNGDGTSTGSRRQWRYLSFAAGSRGTISHAFIGYAGWCMECANATVYVDRAQVSFDHTTITGGDACALWVTEAAPVLRACSLYGNRPSGVYSGIVSQPGGSRLLVDARSCWWGDPSGPYNGTANPTGTGSGVSSGVVFVPWVTDPADMEGATAGVEILAPWRFSPGDRIGYSLTYSTLVPVRDAVLVAYLPEAALLVDDGGGIHMREGDLVFWKLGDLAAGARGTRSLAVQTAWGLPLDFTDSLTAVLGGRGLPTSPPAFDLEKFLTYVPAPPGTGEDLSSDDIEAELAANPAFKALVDQARADDYWLVQGKHRGDGEERYTVLTLLRSPGKGAMRLFRRHLDGVTLRVAATADHVEVVDTWGDGVRLDVESGAATAFGPDPGPLASAADADSDPPRPRCNPPVPVEHRQRCMKNCVKFKFGFWFVKKIIPAVDFADKSSGCAKLLLALQEGEDPTEDFFGCLENWERLEKNAPGWAEFKDFQMCAYNCWGGCQEDVEKWYCTEDDYSAGEEQSWVTRWLNPAYQECGRAYTRTRCVDGDWMLPETLYCDRGEIAVEDYEDEEGRPCVPSDSEAARHCRRNRPAKDPNEKSGPPGDVLAGAAMPYVIDYENVGEGDAHGVYITDVLDPALDEGSIVATGDPVYFPASRTLIWDVGHLPPKGEEGSKGTVSFSASLRPEAGPGTMVANRATVFFPSVPEETPTNVVTNLVALLAADPLELATSAGTPLSFALTGRGPAPLSFEVTRKPGFGDLTGTPPSLTYSPMDGFTGRDVFTFRVARGETTGSPAQVAITVTPRPDDDQPPVVLATLPQAGRDVDNAFRTPPHGDALGPVFPPLLLVELDEELDPDTTSGALVLTGPGGLTRNITVSYDASTRQVIGTMREPWVLGTHTATLAGTVADLRGNALGTPHVWSFRVVPAPGENRAPNAVDDVAATPEDTPVTIAPLANDTDPDGDAITLVGSTPPAHGSVAVGEAGLTYTPATDWWGTDSFSYTVSDPWGGSAGATVTITVTPVNDPPVADGKGTATPEDTPVTITLTARDADGDPLTYQVVEGPFHGALTGVPPVLTYTPGPDYHGPDSFTFNARDDDGPGAGAVVTIAVAPVNDPPVAAADGFTTSTDRTLTVPPPGLLANDTDVDGGALTAVAAEGPDHGILALEADGSFTYTPAAGFSGEDGFTYRASDGTTLSAEAAVTITVHDPFLFGDTFSDGTRKGDPHWVKNSGAWSVDARKRYQALSTSKPNLSTVKPAFLGPLTAGRITAKVMMRRLKAKGQNAMVLFAFRSARAYRYVQLVPGEVRIGQVGNFGGTAAGVAARRTLSAIKTGRVYPVSVDLGAGGQVAVTIPGAGSLSHDFPLAVPGGVGVGSLRNGGQFDDVGVFDATVIP
jgi:hypothetical protein